MRVVLDRSAESQTMAKRKTSTILNYFEPQAKKSRTEECNSESGSESEDSPYPVSPLSRYRAGIYESRLMHSIVLIA